MDQVTRILPGESDAVLDPVRARMPEGFRRIGIGQGWWAMVGELDAKLAALDPDYSVRQVKADFGRLDYVTTTTVTGDDLVAFRAAVRAAEIASSRMCEACGAPGSSSVEGGWVGVYCEQHGGADVVTAT
ncbi:hypothetical protein AB2L57_10820 [Microbacterium sp. HA-8]|uniref:hypothetical protein n=1 Tax=Microbacterium sp. HA-8 TaxID=3234200 RepID=UPI0038F6AB9A